MCTLFVEELEKKKSVVIHAAVSAESTRTCSVKDLCLEKIPQSICYVCFRFSLAKKLATFKVLPNYPLLGILFTKCPLNH